MKKFLALGLMLSLFTFGGNKEEVKTTYAAGEGTSATLSGFKRNLGSDKSKIITIKVTNDESYSTIMGKAQKTYVAGDNISTYLFEREDSTADNIRYDCVVYADVEKIYAPEISSYLFSSFPNVTDIDISALDTSNASTMYCMFDSCTNLKSLTLGKDFNTSKVTDLSWMFTFCEKLEEIKTKTEIETLLGVLNFDTSNVTDMSYMFQCCYALNPLDVSSFNTSKVTNMSSMFSQCKSLEAIDVSNFDTSNVTNMGNMFQVCENLTELNVSNFDTSKVTDMNGMFNHCYKLIELNVSNFDTSNVTNMERMFQGCTFKKLDLSNFDMSSVTNTECMFNGSDNLECLVAPKSLKTGETIELPRQFYENCGVSRLTTSNLAKNEVLDTVGSKFIKEWRTLRDYYTNSICNALVKGTDDNTLLLQLLKQYDTFDADRKAMIDNTIDYEDATIGDSVRYLQDVINGTQSTAKDYGYAKEDSGSFMTLSIKEESPYLIAVISLIGVLSVAGYYFYSKKKHAM